jgi:hypothetical protein
MKNRRVQWSGAACLLALGLALQACGSDEEGSTYCVGEKLDSDFDLTRCGDAVSTGDYLIDGPATLEGLKGCTSLEGSLTVEGSDLSSLGGLESLRCVSGDLTVRSNPSLATLDGLEGLLYVGGSLTIGGLDQGNPKLTTAALSGLLVIEESLWIEHNHRLTTLRGLDRLEHIGGFLGVFDNDQLTSLSDWSALERIGGFLNLAHNDRLPTCRAVEVRDRFPAECRNICIRANKPDACPDDEIGCWYESPGTGGGS